MQKNFFHRQHHRKRSWRWMSTLTTAAALQRLGLPSRPSGYTEAEVATALMLKRGHVAAHEVPLLTEAARFLSSPMEIKRPAIRAAPVPNKLTGAAKRVNKTARRRKAPNKGTPTSAPAAQPQIVSNVRVSGINAATNEFVMEGRKYIGKPRLLVAIHPGDVLIRDLFRNSCRWHPDDVEPRLRGTFNTPNRAGEVLLQTLRPSEKGASNRRTASARKCFFVNDRDAKALIESNAKIADVLAGTPPPLPIAP